MCPAAQCDLVVISFCNFFFHFAQCTEKNDAYSHTQHTPCKKYNARFDQLLCNSLESMSVWSLVECKQTYSHVCLWVFFLVLKIKSYTCDIYAVWRILSIWTIPNCAVMHENWNKNVCKSSGGLSSITYDLNKLEKERKKEKRNNRNKL